MQMADRLASEGHGDSAVAAYTVAMNRFRRDMPIEEKITCIRAHQRLAGYWISRDANLNALQVLMAAREISESCATDSLTVQILNNMAYVYLTFKNYEKAASMFETAQSLQSEGHNPDDDFRLLNNLASTYVMLGNYEKAQTELSRLRAIKGLSPSLAPFAPYHISLIEGALHNIRGQWKSGATMIRKAIEEARKLPYSDELECLALEDLIKSYRGMGAKDSTYSCLLRYDSLARHCNLPDKRIDALRGLSEYYESLGDTQHALDCRHAYLSLSDSVMNYREFARLNNLEFVYQTDKYKGEIANLNLDTAEKSRRLRKQTVTIISLVLVLLIIVALLALVWRQKRRLNQSYHSLFKVHQESMAAEKFNDERQRQLESRISELETGLENACHNSPKSDDVQPSDGSHEKYACSGLKGESAIALGERLRDLLDDIDVLCDPELGIARLAELAGTNSKYVSQAVNETFGMGLFALLNHKRIAEAKRRLADPSNSNLTIAAVAASVGYRNQTSFIAAFKKSVGMTPSTYMKIARESQF